MKEKALLFDGKAISRMIKRISHEIIEKNKGIENLLILGVKSKGIKIGKEIAKCIEEIEGIKVDFEVIDPYSFRDDNKKGREKVLEISSDDKLNDTDIENKCIVLVDDVLYTGRTIRAAIDAVICKGRPKRILLAVLIDRGHREIPIRADFVGKNIPTSRKEKIVVLLSDNENESSVKIFEE